MLDSVKAPIAINNFENANFTYGRYSIYNTGEADYNKAIKILCDNGAVRTVTPSYYNFNGEDVLIKIYPDSARNANPDKKDAVITDTSVCVIRQLGIS